VQDALDIMIECYRKLGLKDLESNVEQVYLTLWHDGVRSLSGLQRLADQRLLFELPGYLS
jgi:hypothetical protein